MAELLIGFGGEGGSAFTEYPVTSGPITLAGGAGRAMANGSTKRGLRLRSVYVSGNGGARTITASLAGSSFTRTVAAGAPTYQGYIGPLVLVDGGSAHYLHITPAGSIRLGRGGGGTTSDGRALNESGTVGGAYAISQAPTAPTLLSAVATGPTSALVTWAIPTDDGNETLTGYRISYATNPAFDGAKTLNLAATIGGVPVTQAELTGLTPGTQVYIRVAARNAVTDAAASSSVYSATESVFLVADVGDLDGWASYGALPAGLTPFIGNGLRRGTVYPLGQGAPSGLIREIQATGSGTVVAAALGIRREFTGLTVGATYAVDATGLILATPVAADAYRISVDDIGAGDTVTVTTTPTPLPTYTFVATDTTHTIRIQLNEAAAWSADGWFEAVAIYGLTLTELPEPSPYRLQDVVYEGPLSRHFALACDTLGARWWVDRAGVTQFRQAASQDEILATFTDERTAGAHEYVNIGVSFNTRDLINMLKVTNHGRNADDGLARDLTYAFADDDSIAAWGPRSSSVDMSLYEPPPAVNLLANPNFESATLGWGTANSQVAGSRQSTVAHRGIYSFRAQAVAATTQLNAVAGMPIPPYTHPVIPGRTYLFAGWAYTSLTSRTVTALIRWGDATTMLSIIGGTAVPVPANTWTWCYVVATAPAGATGAAPQLSISGAVASGNSAFFDEAIFREVPAGYTPTPADYFDGDTPEDAGYTYAWDGPADASPSIRTAKHSLLEGRVAEILATTGTPVREIRSIRWNAQEDPQLAAQLDIQRRLRVTFRGQAQDSRIVGLRHEITGTRWMVDINLERSAS